MHLLVNTPDVTDALMPVCTVILAEMFLGIIVLCIPAAARTCRHHSDSYRKIKSAISSKITRQGSTSKPLTTASSNGPYSDINSKKTAWKHPFAYLEQMTKEGPRTVFRSDNPHDVEEDGVHLTYETKTTVQTEEAKSTNF
ncbi:MAG: hypothetical protein L6R39_005712 [Caloplaca ligustica]|nr:MAG: hypothetical protein L6R39_005712 [Caloplaca ligustica]